MGTRTARFGFALFAVATGLSLALGLWDQLLARQLGSGSDHHSVELQMRLMQYGFWALEVLSIVALVAASRLPASLGARRLLVASAAVEGFGLAVALAEHVLVETRHGGYESLERMFRIVSGVQTVVYTASEVLLLVACLQLARAAAAETLRVAAIAALVVRGAVGIVWLTPFAGSWMHWGHRLSSLLVTIVCAGIAAVLARIPDGEPAASRAAGDSDDGRLSAEWRAPADGISLYLGSVVVRVILAGISFAVMASVRGAQSVHELRDVRGIVLLLAGLSAMASVGTLAGLWKISRAPDEARASGLALIALTLGSLGLALDGWSTSITAEALDGSVSAAFYAMDALPVIAVVSGVLGVGLAASLLGAIGNLATALGCPDLTGHARLATGFVVATGALLGLGALLSRHASEVTVVFMLLALPLAIAALVYFLRAALGVSRVIRERLAR